MRKRGEGNREAPGFPGRVRGGKAAAGGHMGRVWRGDAVPVWDHTTAAWRPHVRTMVSAFNDMLPDEAPTLDYTSMPELRCEALAERSHALRGITVCVVAAEAIAPAAGMVSPYVAAGRVFQHATIQLSSAHPPGNGPLLCHELMHATTGISDDMSRPYAESSCVWGVRRFPGAFDRQFARWVYRRWGVPGTKERCPRKAAVTRV